MGGKLSDKMIPHDSNFCQNCFEETVELYVLEVPERMRNCFLAVDGR